MLSQSQDLRNVVFPPAPFGLQHATDTAELAMHILDSQGASRDEVTAGQAAARFHDLGRQAPWWDRDPQCGARSAAMAERALLLDAGTYDAVEFAEQRATTERICRVIAQHDLDAEHLPTDPLAVALWDADTLETCRFPGSVGRDLVRRRFPRLITTWARQRSVWERWMRHHASPQIDGVPWIGPDAADILRAVGGG